MGRKPLINFKTLSMYIDDIDEYDHWVNMSQHVFVLELENDFINSQTLTHED